MASSGRTRWLNPGYTRYTRSSGPKLRDDLFRYGLALELGGIRRVATGPDPRLVALDRERVAPEQPMLHAKARPLDLHNCRFDRHDVAEHGRNDEARIDIDQRNPDEVVCLQHLMLVEPQSAQEEGVGARIEIAEIVGEIHDPGGRPLTPFVGPPMPVYHPPQPKPLIQRRPG